MASKIPRHFYFLFCNQGNRFNELSRSSTGFIILELGIEAGQIKLKVDEMIECALEAAGKPLPL